MPRLFQLQGPCCPSGEELWLIEQQNGKFYAPVILTLANAREGTPLTAKLKIGIIARADLGLVTADANVQVTFGSVNDLRRSRRAVMRGVLRRHMVQRCFHGLEWTLKRGCVLAAALAILRVISEQDGIDVIVAYMLLYVVWAIAFLAYINRPSRRA